MISEKIYVCHRIKSEWNCEDLYTKANINDKAF